MGCDNYDSLKMDSTHVLSIQKSNLCVCVCLIHTQTAAAQALNFITTARKFSIMLILLTIYYYLYYSHTTVSVESSGYRILDEELELRSEHEHRTETTRMRNFAESLPKQFSPQPGRNLVQCIS